MFRTRFRKDYFFIPHSQSVGILEYPCPSVRSSIPLSCVRNYSFILWPILFIFGMLVGHGARMRILYRFRGWLIFAGVMALYDENSFYILFTLVYAITHSTLADFVHIWYVGWA